MLKKFILALVILVTSFWLPSGRAADTKTPWIHLEVKENNDRLETVKVNLPLSMVETAMNILQNEHFREGHFRMRGHGRLSVADIRKLWEELRKSGDAEFVSVEKDNQTVHISRNGGFLLIKVSASKGKPNQVDVRVPVEVVDALLSSEGEELNIKAALQSLPKNVSGDMLTVHDDHTRVRLWVD